MIFLQTSLTQSFWTYNGMKLCMFKTLFRTNIKISTRSTNMLFGKGLNDQNCDYCVRMTKY